jgi:Cu-Zn family superoxide dismutase
MKRLGMVMLGLAVLAAATMWVWNSTAIGGGKEGGKEGGGKAAMITKAICVVTPVGGKGDVKGLLTFVQKGNMVELTGEITGLKPGKHGFHVHEFGDLSDDKGMNTGPHFNPDGKKHGGHDDKDRHVGDLGNIEADASGKAVVKITDKLLSLNGPHSIIGRAIIVHADADDLTSQPAGNAGARIGSGVIGVAKAEEKK